MSINLFNYNSISRNKYLSTSISGFLDISGYGFISRSNTYLLNQFYLLSNSSNVYDNSGNIISGMTKYNNVFLFENNNNVLYIHPNNIDNGLTMDTDGNVTFNNTALNSRLLNIQNQINGLSNSFTSSNLQLYKYIFYK